MNGQSFSQAGDYPFQYMSLQGCDSVVILHLIVNTIVNSVSINPNNGQALQCSNTSASTYQWFDCNTNEIVPGANGPDLIVTQNGTYGAILTSASGCTDTSNCLTINIIGISEVREDAFYVAPNPVITNFTVYFTTEFTGRLHITDIEGRLVYETRLSNQKSAEAALVGPGGVYFVHVENQEGIKSVRIIKL
ncbi:MAG: T9SS type A sorting domain-containing protein [Bacteroidetes bacterium]|nr:T9SS type A sorting domain-containing protein [Bacteroidota bacterium]